MNFHLVKFEMSCGLANQLPQSTLPEVVFAGRSNVGKSSLINKIFNQKQLARVSATPGKTATINFFRCGDVARFADLPGYGYAKVSDSERRRWSGLIEGYFHQDRDIRLSCPFWISAMPPALMTSPCWISSLIVSYPSRWCLPRPIS